jgi:hypothetical protein
MSGCMGKGDCRGLANLQAVAKSVESTSCLPCTVLRCISHFSCQYVSMSSNRDTLHSRTCCLVLTGYHV